MKRFRSGLGEMRPQDGRANNSLLILAGLTVVVVLVAIFLPRQRPITPAKAPPGPTVTFSASAPVRSTSRSLNSRFTSDPALSPQEIVAQKIQQFSKNRREVFRALAKRHNVVVPPEVERFFDAVERGNWEEIDAAHEALLLSKENLNQPKSPEIHQIWRPIQEVWGAAREAHKWPAQTLLDYGEAVLGSLRPGMIYVGGTDPGCFIPTFLNETSEGERHVTLTQNALADGTYLDYLSHLYGERLNTLTTDDSQRAFQNYLTDAQKRLEHDLQFPDDPKQLRPNESVKMTDGRVLVDGQVAVMAINEILLKTLMDKNPDASFAIEQSFAFKSMYGDTAPLGPIMELRASDVQNSLTAERATQSVDFWQNTAHQLIANPETPAESDPRRAYAKLASEQAALYLDRSYAGQAEQIYRLASELCPSMPEAVFGYVGLLQTQKRFGEALQVAQTAVAAAPKNKDFAGLVETLKKLGK